MNIRTETRLFMGIEINRVKNMGIENNEKIKF